MDIIGTFESKHWGRVEVRAGTYLEQDGPLAVALTTPVGGDPLATLSVNMYKPHCSADSRDLPKDCFYVKTWAENTDLAHEAFESGLFIARPDLPVADSGWVEAPVWQIKPRGDSDGG